MVVCRWILSLRWNCDDKIDNEGRQVNKFHYYTYMRDESFLYFTCEWFNTIATRICNGDRCRLFNDFEEKHFEFAIRYEVEFTCISVSLRYCIWTGVNTYTCIHCHERDNRSSDYSKLTACFNDVVNPARFTAAERCVTFLGYTLRKEVLNESLDCSYNRILWIL